MKNAFTAALPWHTPSTRVWSSQSLPPKYAYDTQVADWAHRAQQAAGEEAGTVVKTSGTLKSISMMPLPFTWVTMLLGWHWA